MIALFASLAAVGVALALSRLFDGGKETDRDKSGDKDGKADKKDKKAAQKREEIRQRGGLLARHIERLPKLDGRDLNVLHIGATQTDVEVNLATERSMAPVPYPARQLDFVPVTEAWQIPSLSAEQFGLPDDEFYQRFVTGGLLRPEFSEEIANRKRMYVLLDVSPSMYEREYGAMTLPDGTEGLRDTYARGIVAGLLADAERENAEYLFRAFDRDVYSLKSAHDAESAERLLELVLDKCPRGTGTDIGTAIKQAVEDLRERRAVDRSFTNHVLLITDGDDQSSLVLTGEWLTRVLGDDTKLMVIRIGTKWTADNPLWPYVIKTY